MEMQGSVMVHSYSHLYKLQMVFVEWHLDYYQK